MAHRADESPTAVGDDKTPIKVDAQQDIQGQSKLPNAATRAAEEDYPVERVEAVYRQLDLRIIPGWLLYSPILLRTNFWLTRDRHSILDPLLSLFRYSLQYWPGPDHERGSRT